MSGTVLEERELENIVSDNRYMQEYFDKEGLNASEVRYISSESLKYKPDTHQMYQLDDKVFVHISKESPTYNVVSPYLESTDSLVQELGSRLLEQNNSTEISQLYDMSETEIRNFAESQLAIPKGSRMNFLQSMTVDIGTNIYCSEQKSEGVISTLTRDICEYGHVTPMMKDDNIEYIHVTDASNIVVNLSGYGLVETSIKISSDVYDDFLKTIVRKSSEEYKKSKLSYDGKLDDGSRISVVLSGDSSHSLTIRQSRSSRLSILDLVESNTLDMELSAYLWSCFDNNMNIFFAGETASGKTTLANSCLSFVEDSNKVVTIEDTSELYPPQKTWQKLISDEDASMQNLLVKSLRMNPDIISVGEVRGKETSTLFQAMESGHPVITTIHSDTINSIVNRLQDEPIGIPKRSISEIDVIVFLDKIIRPGGEVVRVVDSVVEIGKYYEKEGLIESRTIFDMIEIGQYTSDIRSSMMSEYYESSISLKSDIKDREEFLKQIYEKQQLSYYEIYDMIQQYE